MAVVVEAKIFALVKFSPAKLVVDNDECCGIPFTGRSLGYSYVKIYFMHRYYKN